MNFEEYKTEFGKLLPNFFDSLEFGDRKDLCKVLEIMWLSKYGRIVLLNALLVLKKQGLGNDIIKTIAHKAFLSLKNDTTVSPDKNPINYLLNHYDAIRGLMQNIDNPVVDKQFACEVIQNIRIILNRINTIDYLPKPNNCKPPVSSVITTKNLESFVEYFLEKKIAGEIKDILTNDYYDEQEKKEILTTAINNLSPKDFDIKRLNGATWLTWFTFSNKNNTPETESIRICEKLGLVHFQEKAHLIKILIPIDKMNENFFRPTFVEGSTGTRFKYLACENSLKEHGFEEDQDYGMTVDLDKFVNQMPNVDGVPELVYPTSDLTFENVECTYLDRLDKKLKDLNTGSPNSNTITSSLRSDEAFSEVLIQKYSVIK
jgi:hypothetical protein